MYSESEFPCNVWRDFEILCSLAVSTFPLLAFVFIVVCQIVIIYWLLFRV